MNRSIVTSILSVCVAVGAAGAAPTASAATAGDILRATGVEGGLVVHVGCGDGRLTAALRANGRYIVVGLERDAAKVAAARQYITSRGLYGPVSVDRFDGRRLPFVDGLVNLVVSEDAGAVPEAEVLRVLAPGGVAYVRAGGAWRKTVKPRPGDIDEWSHFLHDAGGNAVAKDRRVGPPRGLHWLAGPRWCRSHEFPSSVGAVVTAGGRIFTIFDEAPTGVYLKLPQRCSLIARDAWNGVLLWKVPLRRWQPEFGTGRGNRWNIHHTIPRRVVTDGERVYVTLAFLDSPVSVLDAATGKTLTEALPGTKGADELLLCDGVLVVKTRQKRSVGATEKLPPDAKEDNLCAVDVSTGRLLWQKRNITVVPYALSAAGGRVVYHNTAELVCMELRTGKECWQAACALGSTSAGLSNLIITDGVVLYHGPVRLPAAETKAPAEKPAGASRKGRKPRGGTRQYLTAWSLSDGRQLWRRPGARGMAQACTQPTDVFVCGGLVWCGGTLQGVDLHSGEVKKTLSIGKLISPGHHYRCHRSKATERYLIWPKRGAEFVDTEGDNHMRNDWLRAPCFTGLTPANGLLYVPSNPCFCYPGVRLSGYLSLSADAAATKLKPAGPEGLHRGEAYGKVPAAGATAGPEDWPMFRRDVRRCGSTVAAVPAEPVRRWEVALASRGSQPVVVGERLWIAEKDAHRIRCLDAATGRDVWTFTAGGRIDSAPTYSDGALLFGCRDGAVYCLRASDGALAWRYRPGPDVRTVAFEQVESLWPVHGSVLVQGGVVYFAAGRSSFLDGGILVCGVDVRTGRLRYSHLLEGPWPDIRKDVGRPFAMEGALPDILVSDGRDLFMLRVKFDAKLNRLPVRRESDLGELDMGSDHLVATNGFLDDSGFDRIYQMHSRRWPGFYFAQHSPKAGQLVVFDDEAAYAVKYFYRRIVWSPVFHPGEQGYLLFSDDLDNEPALDERGRKSVAIDWLPKGAATDRYRRGGRGVEKGTGYVRTRPPRWQQMVPVRVRAMVLAADRLVVAGPPDVLDPADPLAAFEGRRGAVLRTFSAADGRALGSLKLKSPPAFDGMIAAGGRLYVATEDGRLLCLGGRQ